MWVDFKYTVTYSEHQQWPHAPCNVQKLMLLWKVGQLKIAYSQLETRYDIVLFINLDTLGGFLTLWPRTSHARTDRLGGCVPERFVGGLWTCGAVCGAPGWCCCCRLHIRSEAPLIDPAHLSALHVARAAHHALPAPPLSHTHQASQGFPFLEEEKGPTPRCTLSDAQFYSQRGPREMPLQGGGAVGQELSELLHWWLMSKCESLPPSESSSDDCR